jgi:hypothetical protein
MRTPISGKRWLWILAVAAVVAAAWFTFPPTRRLGQGFFASLRVQKVQAVNVDLSSFVGSNPNPALHEMVSKMIADKVTTTVDEKNQPAPTAAAASQLAGFQVVLLSARKDAPELAVGGAHAFELHVDRTRLQEILKEAGRPDLALPESIDGSTVAVKISRTVRARYGNCPAPPSATANIATPTPTSMQYDDCVVLSEGPSPEVNVPPGLDLANLSQIGLELAGMTPSQAQQFLQTVDWRSMLRVSVPRSMRSYQAVEVNGSKGALLNMAGRRGPTYTLIWAKNGIVYSLTGFGDSSNAVSLANSVR